MKSLALLILLTTWFASFSARAELADVAQVKSAATQPIRILFLGNSLTGYHNLPGMIQELAARSGVSSHIEAHIRFGQTLDVHFADPVVRASFQSQLWDYVVLQDYSDLALRDFKAFRSHVIQFQKLAKPTGAKILLAENWAYAQAPAGTQEKIAQAYKQVASETGTEVVPLGDATNVVRTQSRINVFAPNDDRHPSVSASYMVAAIYLSRIFGIAPGVLPHEAADLNTPDVYSGPATTPVLINIDRLSNSKSVTFLQSVASQFAPLHQHVNLPCSKTLREPRSARAN